MAEPTPSAPGTAGRATSRWRIVALTALAVGLIAVGIVGIIRNVPGPVIPPGTTTTTDMAGNIVAADPGSGADPATLSQMAVVPSTGERFAVPSVGLDVPLGSLKVVGGLVDPPGFTAAYWVRNEGVSPALATQGTVFVAMHSLRGGGVAPGNYLIDVAQGRATVAVGSKITVGPVTYRVTGTHVIAKPTLPFQDAIWANVPNRLVVITCLQRPDGHRSVDNVVITATRIG